MQVMIQKPVHYLTEKLGKLLVVKDLETTARRNLADSRRVKAVMIVAVAALHKYTAVTETLRKHLTSDVIQVNPCQQVNIQTGKRNNI